MTGAVIREPCANTQRRRSSARSGQRLGGAAVRQGTPRITGATSWGRESGFGLVGEVRKSLT